MLNNKLSNRDLTKKGMKIRKNKFNTFIHFKIKEIIEKNIFEHKYLDEIAIKGKHAYDKDFSKRQISQNKISQHRTSSSKLNNYEKYLKQRQQLVENLQDKIQVLHENQKELNIKISKGNEERQKLTIENHELIEMTTKYQQKLKQLVIQNTEIKIKNIYQHKDINQRKKQLCKTHQIYILELEEQIQLLKLQKQPLNRENIKSWDQKFQFIRQNQELEGKNQQLKQKIKELKQEIKQITKKNESIGNVNKKHLKEKYKQKSTYY